MELCLVGDVQVKRPLSREVSSLGLLSQADLLYGNLETPLSMKGYPADKLVTLRSDPSLAGDLRRMNFDVMTLANNHALDYGRDAFFETLAVLRRAGIKTVGAGSTLSEALSPVILEREGIKVGFMGCASTLPLDSAAGEDKPGIAPIRVKTYLYQDPTLLQEQPGTPPDVLTEPLKDDLDRVCEAVSKTKLRVDFVVVGIHWGVAFQPTVIDYQKEVARRLINSGADFVVGHHPHVLHGIEKRKRGYVFYSLGNFMFHHKIAPEIIKKAPRSLGGWDMSPHSLIIKLTLGKEASRVQLVPVVLNSRGNPQLCDGSKATAILEEVRRLSEPLGPSIRIINGTGILR